MEMVIDYEILKVLNGEHIFKEESVAAKNALDKIHFENVLPWQG
jgi:hypothetical protein